MKPYSSQKLSDSKRIFDYRLSRAQRTTENAFGILSNRFRALFSRMYLQPAMQPLAAATSRHPTHNAEKIRDIFRKYFYGRGQVSWQWKHVN